MIPVLFLSCLALTVSGSILTDVRIIDGIETTIEQHPYHVALFSGSSYLCGGSILSDEWVLTAAHCYGVDNVHAGVTNRATSTKTSDILKFIRHPIFVMHEAFDDMYGSDIAVCKLKQKLPLDGVTMKAVKLADATPEEGHMCTVTGWGRTSPAIHGGSDILRKADVPVASRSYCKKQLDQIIRNLYTLGDLCLGGNNHTRNACFGDSGSPAVNQNGEQVGIVSRGHPDCYNTYFPVIFTDVNHQRRFIKKNTGL